MVSPAHLTDVPVVQVERGRVPAQPCYCESLSQLTLASGFKSVAFFEDAPVAHGLKSGVRLVLWKLIRAVLRFYLTVETGSPQQPVLTQNMLAVAIK